jgi:hypothetical protein
MAFVDRLLHMEEDRQSKSGANGAIDSSIDSNERHP